MLLEHELERTRKEYEMAINRRFESLEHEYALNHQETRHTANGLIASLDQKLKQDFEMKQTLINKIDQRIDKIENEYILRIRELKTLVNNRVENSESKYEEVTNRVKNILYDDFSTKTQILEENARRDKLELTEKINSMDKKTQNIVTSLNNNCQSLKDEYDKEIRKLIHK